MLRKLFNTTFLCCSFMLFACNTEKDTDNGQTFRDYKEFVTQVEKDTVVPSEEGLDSTWYQRTSVLQEKYDSIHNNINITLDDLKPEQQQEVIELDQRYELAQSTINKKREDISKRYKMREELLGLKVKRDDLSSITAEELAPAYQNFVKKLSDNYKGYTTEEWQHIEGWWNALNNRHQQLTNEISGEAKSTIDRAQQQYLTIRKDADIEQPTP